MTDRRVAAILVAAGAGVRLGSPVPKAFVHVAGSTLLEHAAERFRAYAGRLVIVAPAAELARAHELVPGAQVVAGGELRQDSVACGLAALDEAEDPLDVVLVHDVARAFVPPAVIERVIAAVRGGAEAVVPVVPVADTLRRVDGGVVDRSTLRAVQTPQGFRPDVLRAAHAGPHRGATDDAGLAELAGYHVTTVEGAAEAFKITGPLDLLLAEAMAR